MKLSKYIKHLTAIKNKQGDINVYVATERDSRRNGCDWFPDLYSNYITFRIVNPFDFNSNYNKILYIRGIDKDFEKRKKEK